MRISDWSSDVCSSDLACTLSKCLSTPSMTTAASLFAGDAGVLPSISRSLCVRSGGSPGIDFDSHRHALAQSSVGIGVVNHDSQAIDQVGDRKSTRLNSSH